MAARSRATPTPALRDYREADRLTTGQPEAPASVLEGKTNPGLDTYAVPCPTCDRKDVPSGAFTVEGLERHFLAWHGRGALQ